MKSRERDEQVRPFPPIPCTRASPSPDSVHGRSRSCTKSRERDSADPVRQGARHRVTPGVKRKPGGRLCFTARVTAGSDPGVTHQCHTGPPAGCESRARNSIPASEEAGAAVPARMAVSSEETAMRACPIRPNRAISCTLARNRANWTNRAPRRCRGHLRKGPILAEHSENRENRLFGSVFSSVCG